MEINRTSKFDRVVSAVLPISFIGSGFLNAMVYPLGLHAHDTLRTLVTFGIIGLVALLLLIKVVSLWINRSDLRHFLWYTLLIPAVFAIVYIFALLRISDKALILKNIITSGCYLVSACCAIIVIAAERRLQSFLRTFRIYALIFSPVMLYYCIRFYLPSAKYGVENLGVLDYMTLAYALLSFTLALFLDAAIYGSVSGQSGKKQKWTVGAKVDFVLYCLFCVAITLTQTKGTILCLVWSGILITIYMFLVPPRRFQFPIAAVLCVAIFSTVLFPNYAGGNRLISFFEELKQNNQASVQDYVNIGQIMDKVDTTTAPTEPSNPPTEPSNPPTEPSNPPTEPSNPPTEPSTPPTEPSNPPTEPSNPPTEPSAPSTEPSAPSTEPSAPSTEPSAPSTEPSAPSTEPSAPPTEPTAPGDKNESLVMGNVVEFVNSGKAKAALLAGEITQEEYDALVAMCQKLNNTATGGRMYLWSCALAEIKASPIFGNGLFSYQAKYNAYPHNFFLEIAADMGLPATLLILALGIYVFIQLLRMALINKEIMAFTLYVMTYLVRNMISSSAYSYETFVQYGFCILIVVWGRKLLKKNKK